MEYLESAGFSNAYGTSPDQSVSSPLSVNYPANAGNAANTELLRHVAGAGSEEERRTGGHSEDAIELPPTDDSVRESAFVQEPFALTNRKFVGQRPGEHMRYVVLRKPFVALAFERRDNACQSAPRGGIRLRVLGGGDQLRECIRSEHPNALRESPLCF